MNYPRRTESSSTESSSSDSSETEATSPEHSDTDAEPPSGDSSAAHAQKQVVFRTTDGRLVMPVSLQQPKFYPVTLVQPTSVATTESSSVQPQTAVGFIPLKLVHSSSASGADSHAVHPKAGGSGTPGKKFQTSPSAETPGPGNWHPRKPGGSAKKVQQTSPAPTQETSTERGRKPRTGSVPSKKAARAGSASPASPRGEQRKACSSTRVWGNVTPPVREPSSSPQNPRRSSVPSEEASSEVFKKPYQLKRQYRKSSDSGKERTQSSSPSPPQPSTSQQQPSRSVVVVEDMGARSTAAAAVNPVNVVQQSPQAPPASKKVIIQFRPFVKGKPFAMLHEAMRSQGASNDVICLGSPSPKPSASQQQQQQPWESVRIKKEKIDEAEAGSASGTSQYFVIQQPRQTVREEAGVRSTSTAPHIARHQASRSQGANDDVTCLGSPSPESSSSKQQQQRPWESVRIKKEIIDEAEARSASGTSQYFVIQQPRQTVREETGVRSTSTAQHIVRQQPRRDSGSGDVIHLSSLSISAPASSSQLTSQSQQRSRSRSGVGDDSIHFVTPSTSESSTSHQQSRKSSGAKNDVIRFITPVTPDPSTSEQQSGRSTGARRKPIHFLSRVTPESSTSQEQPWESVKVKKEIIEEAEASSAAAGGSHLSLQQPHWSSGACNDLFEPDSSIPTQEPSSSQQQPWKSVRVKKEKSGDETRSRSKPYPIILRKQAPWSSGACNDERINQSPPTPEPRSSQQQPRRSSGACSDLFESFSSLSTSEPSTSQQQPRESVHVKRERTESETISRSRSRTYPNILRKRSRSSSISKRASPSKPSTSSASATEREPCADASASNEVGIQADFIPQPVTFKQRDWMLDGLEITKLPGGCLFLEYESRCPKCKKVDYKYDLPADRAKAKERRDKDKDDDSQKDEDKDECT